MPAIIAHRGGANDYPENTLLAIRGALANHADIIWLTVQVSRDGVPVLYRPTDLKTLTNSNGPVAAKTAEALSHIHAAWHFQDSSVATCRPANVFTDSTRDTEICAGANPQYPYRDSPVGIPTLAAALASIPPQIPVILDLKSLPAAPLAEAVMRVLDKQDAWSRVSIYSTNASYQNAFGSLKHVSIFESRDATRQRLFGVALTGKCITPSPGARAGFEMKRQVTLSEQFTLGKGESTFDAAVWTPASVQCYRRAAFMYLVAFAVNDLSDYQKAACLGMDAVLSDSPAQMYQIKERLRFSLDCNQTKQ